MVITRCILVVVMTYWSHIPKAWKNMFQQIVALSQCQHRLTAVSSSTVYNADVSPNGLSRLGIMGIVIAGFLY